MARKRRLLEKWTLVYAATFLGVLLLDQATKALARRLAVGESIELLPGILWFTHVQNTGASFGMLQGSNLLLLWVALFAFGILAYHYDSFTTRGEKLLYSLLMAGILGNFLDRALQGSVTDFLDLGWWPVFNVADSALVIGILGLVAVELFWKREKTEKRRAPKSKKSSQKRKKNPRSKQ